MHEIPQEILTLFTQADPSAEKRLLAWLLENKIEELNCSRLQIPFYQIVKIAGIIAQSSVHTVNFSKNKFGTYGPAVAANLTQEHSKVQIIDFSENYLGLLGPKVAANLTQKHSQVQIVNFSQNEFRKYGPFVASNLTGKHSKVCMVDLTENDCAEDDPAMIKGLTGRYSKIIDVKGVKLTYEQLKENTANFFMQCSELNRNSLEGLAFKAYYVAVWKDMSDTSLTHHIALLSSQERTKGIMALIKVLLFYKGKLKLKDLIENNTDEIMKCIAENCSEMEPVSQVAETFHTLTFSERKASNNECNQELVEADKQMRAAVLDQTASKFRREECNCTFL